MVAVGSYVELDATALDQLHAFVANGGGHLSGGQAWWWAQQTGGDAATEFHGNLHLAPAGIVISGSPELSAGAVPVADTPPGRDHRIRKVSLNELTTAIGCGGIFTGRFALRGAGPRP